jgi:hypothetical protein
MGTPVAPSFACLYLSLIETNLTTLNRNFRLFKRYIDDGFLLYRDANDDMEPFRSFLSEYNLLTGLEFTFQTAQDEIDFLDLTVFKNGELYGTKSYQKKLNLHLYIPPASAHPPGVIKSLICGRIKKFKKQNTRDVHYREMVQTFFQNLIDRGHKPSFLRPIFSETMNRLETQQQQMKENSCARKWFVKVPYDPKGPDSRSIKNLFESDIIEGKIGGRMIVCYQSAPNLKSMICKSDYTNVPNISELLDHCDENQSSVNNNNLSQVVINKRKFITCVNNDQDKRLKTH